MKKPYLTTPEPKASSTWERLEDFVHEHVQQFIQALLEEEVSELLTRFPVKEFRKSRTSKAKRPVNSPISEWAY